MGTGSMSDGTNSKVGRTPHPIIAHHPTRIVHHVLNMKHWPPTATTATTTTKASNIPPPPRH